MVAYSLQLEQALWLLRRLLGRILAAVYLHGSAVAGGLRPKSDLDLLAVVERPLAMAARRELVAGLLNISAYPYVKGGLRPLELIIFERAALSGAACPARAEFVYGEWLREAFEAGTVPMPVSDPELTLVLAQAGEEAVPLLGPSAPELLPVVPPGIIRRAVLEALPGLLDSLQGDEINVLLTLARMWLTLDTGKFAPKDVASVWAESLLPPESAAVLAWAREAYLDGRGEERPPRPQDLAGAVERLRGRVLAAHGGQGAPLPPRQ